MKPLMVDLFCGLGGWAEGGLAENYDVVGFDVERHVYGPLRYPAQLVLQDVLTLHGAQFKDATLIVASPPCQAYSYRAMPWSRAKALPPPDNSLFEACFRIQREASEAAGRHIPMVVENVRGAQKWVGRARWNYGSFYLWGDVPALMPITLGRAVMKHGIAHRSNGATNFHGNTDGVKQGGSGAAWWREPLQERRKAAPSSGLKRPGIDLSKVGFNVANAKAFGHLVEGAHYKRTADDKRQHIGTKRKAASAMIAKIPLALSRHIAAVYARDAVSDGGAAAPAA